jgi:hypothetical protein
LDTTPRALSGILTTSVLGGLATTLTTLPAAARFKQRPGHVVAPGRAESGRGRLGSCLVGGRRVFRAQVDYNAPHSDEQYRPGDELRTKGGDPLPAGVAAEISHAMLTNVPNEVPTLIPAGAGPPAAVVYPGAVVTTSPLGSVTLGALAPAGFPLVGPLARWRRPGQGIRSGG